MKNSLSRRQLLGGGLAAATLVPMTAPHAEAAWPSRPIRFIVPYPPGGSTDVVGRLIGQALSEELGQPIVIENRGGATATIGSQVVAQAKPDGYTLLLSNIASHAIAATLFRSLPYDPVKDFTHIALLVNTPTILVVNPSFPARNLADIVRLSKEKPGGLDMASSGSGSSNHLLLVRFAELTGAQLNHVPYRGGGPAMTDVIAGTVPMMSDTLPSALPHLLAGSVRPIAVSGPERSALMPEVPTFREQGIDLINLPWYGLSGPAGLEPAIVNRLSEATRKILASTELRARLGEIGSIPGDLGPEQYTTLVREEVGRWAPVVRASGASAE
ncbi:tripartite tricarboxylate transporter substrate binding protein [Pseudoroseomonas wenyumeiae]|uniref:Tripartite tricarboxylate transporter substrate binding protein n=1 Tax=Teichococcus wenyumeiae TaxID=2478470 RepID=A0A3A9JQY1_9PROT|nr:tripartite tricarboxylate transporter substrate binding protein [Pseudoroseomonas wenyumeiae]RKK01369.1 tripartite tricarboxylate transporter substrate binding protein [Pseudoroseomonas wenyumeiae]RMI14676.1 tripartite tricarboxylate transporter substrate binding protein [Pseudoroseomonas wenyumeiae]